MNKEEIKCKTDNNSISKKEKKPLLFILLSKNVVYLIKEQFMIIISSYHSLRDRLESNIFSSKAGFTDLTPNNKIEKGDEYFKALDWALHNENIRNIALTGTYGSGKSSIIQSYLKLRPSSKHINISLASFMQEKVDDKGEIIDTLIEINGMGLEESILKQLFYKVSHRKIPQSRYRKLHNISYIKTLFFVSSIMALSIATALFYKPDLKGTMKDILNYSMNYFHITTVVILIWGITLIIAGLCIFSYLLWLCISKLTLKEFGVSDKANIAIGTKADSTSESAFNKQMDEILYFFEATKFNTLFIEDLDRFKSPEIFIKLRELNSILNQYEVIKRRIVFVYAVRDDMFTKADRTKFFDFIIPVVPYINSTNSGELLNDKITKAGVVYNISHEYISKVSVYIDDMRILNNIFNEFVIYKNMLCDGQKLKLNDEQMMSIIIFKNLYPKDFAELQIESGIVKDAFEEIGAFKDSLFAEIEKEKAELESLLRNIDNDNLNDLKELKAVILCHLSNKGVYTVSALYNDSNTITVNEFFEDEFDMEWFRNKRISIIDSYNRNHTMGKIDEIFPPLGKKSILDRCINLKESINKIAIKKQLTELLEKERKIRYLKVREVVSDYGEKVFTSNKITKNKLLLYMLRNGYIDETYSNYMNYFHEKSITKDDMNFILGVRNLEKKEYSYPLTQKGLVVDRLIENEFEQKEIYNNDLLDYMLKNAQGSEKLRIFMNQLADKEEMSWEFIDQFFSTTTQPDTFIALLGRTWPGLWNTIATDPILTDNRKSIYLTLILSNLSIELIAKMNFARDINHFIENHQDIFILLNGVAKAKIKEVLKHFMIVLSDVDFSGVDGEIIDYIYYNNLYTLNTCMIHNYILNKQPDRVSDSLVKNFTVLREIGYDPMLQYIDSNMEVYIKNVLLPTSCEESVDAMKHIYKMMLHDIDICLSLTEKQSIEFPLFSDLSDKVDIFPNEVNALWDQLMRTNKIEVSWVNIATYWKHFGITDILADFIDKNINILLSSKNNVVPDDFTRDILINTKLSMESYVRFLSIFKIDNFDIPLSNFLPIRLKRLIDIRYFPLTPDRYIELHEFDIELCQLYIANNKEDFLNNIDQYHLDINMVEYLLFLDTWSEYEKVVIIHSLSVDDISNNIAIIIKNITIKIGIEYFNKAWELLLVEGRFELLLNQIRQLSLTELENKFHDLGGEYAPLTDRTKIHKFSLSKSAQNRKLLDNLVQMKYISSYKEEGTDSYDNVLHTKVTILKFTGYIRKSS